MKRAYKLQEFVAHSSNVNCLKIGKKSSRVLVTGGEDHKVNMWAIGKPNAILSLSGHTSAVESVTFDAAEVVVVAGAASGTIKLWDLEEAKIVRTLTGHRSNCIAVDFHPFGEFFASGSLDTNLKIWDIRRKGCIHTYKGHTRGINSIKFSPDGRWVVSGGEDNVVKLWDLTAGKLMHDFKYHDGQVQCLDFHPHEFLLATGSADRTVKFFDLETFELIGSAGPEATGVRSMVFNPDGRTVLCAMQDSLKVLSWEPLRCHDVVDVGWHKLADLCIHEGKLLGCSYNQSCVGVWVVDLQRVAPYQAGNPGRANNIVAGKFGNNGHQAAQQVSTMPSTKSDNATMDLPQMMEMAMRNVKVTPTKAAESASHQPRPSTPVSSRGPATVTTTVLSTPTPPAASRRSSLTTARVQTNTSLFRSSPRADSMRGGSPRRPTEPTSAHAIDDTRPASSTGVVSATTIKSEDRNPEALRGDAGADALRIDPVVHVNRTGPAKGSFDSADRTGLGLMFQRSAKLSDTHGGNKEEDMGVNWNGSRNYRRSSSFDVPMDNSLGRSQSFSDDMSRVQSTRNITGTEASTTGRVEVGRTKALLAQWERKEKPSPAEKLNLEKHNYVVEKPTYVAEKPNYVVEKPNFVVEKPSQERSQYLEKSSYQEVSSGTTTSGVRTLGLDINSFVPKGSNFASDKLASAQKHDIEIIEELMHQHHTMASIMQSRLTNMQVVRRFWSKNDVRGAVEAMKKMTDQSVLVDVLTVLMERSEVLTLEICCMLIPLLNGLLSSENDRFLMTALQLLGKLVETFGPVIHATRASSPSLGVDLHAEQRLERCNMCYHELQTVGHCLLPLMRRGGNLTKAAKELRGALEQV